MKYLKKFNESVEISKEMENYIRDILIEFTSNYLTIDIGFIGEVLIILIGADLDDREIFRASDYIEDIEHLNNYMESCGYTFIGSNKYKQNFEKFISWVKLTNEISFLKLEYIKTEIK